MSLLKWGFIFLLLFNAIFASWFVVHKDIYFSSDIGRDFLLLRQVDEKKIVLIGPRASGNLFHGPLWLYINYPAYAISKGDPLAVGWNWVLLWAVFTAICFFVAYKLFDNYAAILFTSLASLNFAFFVRGMTNPVGAMLLMPLLIYFFVSYIQSTKPRFLIFYFLTLGAVTQFEIGLGGPFIILSIPPLAYYMYKHKKKLHSLAFLVLVVSLGNFFLFDIRHHFLILHNTLRFISPTESEHKHFFNYLLLLQDRLSLIISNVQFLRTDIGFANSLIFICAIIGSYLQIKKKQFTIFYLSSLYFYFGFFILSMIDKGPVLYWYLFPMFPLMLLVVSSFAASRLRNLVIFIFIVIIIVNIRTALNDIHSSQELSQTIFSWHALDTMSKRVFEGKEHTFGYFVYAPDALAYEEKYAMYYESRHSLKQVVYFTKKPVTYLILEPPPMDNPYMKADWWIKNQVTITSSPSAILTFPNGYVIEKFYLTDSEIKVPFDPSIDPGLNFR